MTAAPNGQKKSAEENTPASDTSTDDGLGLGPVNQAIPEDTVAVTKPATGKDIPDPSGNATRGRKPSVKAYDAKKDALAAVDLEKLPISVQRGGIIVSVRKHVGQAVVGISPVGWVGDDALTVRAVDLHEVEEAIAELRKELA